MDKFNFGAPRISVAEVRSDGTLVLEHDSQLDGRGPAASGAFVGFGSCGLTYLAGAGPLRDPYCIGAGHRGKRAAPRRSFRPSTLDFVSTPEAPGSNGIGYFPDEAIISIPVE